MLRREFMKRMAWVAIGTGIFGQSVGVGSSGGMRQVSWRLTDAEVAECCHFEIPSSEHIRALADQINDYIMQKYWEA